MSLDVIGSIYSKTQNVIIERSVIGALLYYPELIIKQEAMSLLKQELFVNAHHRAVYVAIKDIVFGSEFDPTIAYNKISQSDVFKIMSPEKLNVTMEAFRKAATYSGDKIREHILMLQELYMKRCYLQLAQDMVIKISNKEDIFELEDFTKKELENIYDLPIQTVLDSKQLTKDPNIIIEMNSDVRIRFDHWNKLMPSIEPGSFILIAGRTSMGKTAFTLNLMIDILRQNHPVLMFSIEMTAKELMRRFIAIETDFDINDVKSAKFCNQPDNNSAVLSAFEIVKRWPVYINDKTSKLIDIINQIKFFCFKHKIKIVIIDYLQLIHYSAAGRNREQEVSHISRTLKGLAKELGITIIALSQLSRAPEGKGRKTPRPVLSDLRESGSLEQDADVVIFLFRKDYYDEEKMNNRLQKAEIIQAKGRNVGVGSFFMTFKPYSTKFENIK